MRFIIALLSFLVLAGCQQMPVRTLPLSAIAQSADADLVDKVQNGQKVKNGQKVHNGQSGLWSDADCAPSASALTQLLCLHQRLAQTPTEQEVALSTLAQYNLALSSVISQHLPAGKWQPHGQGYQLRLNLPLDEHQQPFTRYSLLRQLQFEDPIYQPQPPLPDELGVPLVAERPNTEQDFDRHYPQEGIFRSVTVTLQQVTIENGIITLALQGHYLTEPRQSAFAGRSFPLSYDPATATLLLLREARIHQSALQALLDGNKPGYRFGIYSPAPIRADRKPILMIHGLNSSPYIWLKLSHAIYRDPELSAKYQVWHAFYPTGAPPFFNAMRLRADVDAMRLQLQQQAGFAADTPMILIGHSMGGIIAKTFIVNSEMALWDQTFRFRPELWPVDDPELRRYRDVFLFKARPYVEAVFFLDTPHHGAEVAEAWYSRLAARLITLPQMFARLNRKLFQRMQYERVTPQMRPYLSDGGPNSVQVLSPQHPLLRTIATLPYQRPVYSVVGSNTQPFCYNERTCAQLNDSVVPFFSAHEPRAEQQIIVKSAHDSYQSDDAIAFILQQLKARSAQP